MKKILIPISLVFLAMCAASLDLQANNETEVRVALTSGSMVGSGTLAASSFDVQSDSASAWLVGSEDVYAPSQTATPIPLAELGAKADAQYQGDGLSIVPAEGGAHLRCVFQKLEGQATAEGLWLVSTASGARSDRFRIVAASVALDRNPVGIGTLAHTGTVAVVEKLVRFVRPGLVEEYSVSVDGVRQDFLVLQRPGGEGRLRVELNVAGAKPEPLVNGVRLVLEGSGRRLAYSRLRVVDARGRELGASMEVASANSLAVLVDDATAVYPVRIDPCFSDADWGIVGGLSGSSPAVYALAVSGSDLYVGGQFTTAGGLTANNIAKWNGTAWSTLGTGLGAGVDQPVAALAVSGNNLYVGGALTTAGGVAANSIAKWDISTSTWSALGSAGENGLSAPNTGHNSVVDAIAILGNNVYVAGTFTMAGSHNANYIASWNTATSLWSPLGAGANPGLDNEAYALAVSGSDLYVGGAFSSVVGGPVVNHIAKWNSGGWSALDLGCDSFVYALAVPCSDPSSLYVGGQFTHVGSANISANAKIGRAHV